MTHFKFIALLLLLLFNSLDSFSQLRPRPLQWNHIVNFHSGEFDCTCGDLGAETMNLEFVRRLDIARDISGVPFIISSAFRSEGYNSMIGGVLNSSHTTGFAADIYCRTDKERFEIIRALLLVGFNRIGIYKYHVHVDMDSTKTPYVLWYH